MSTPQGGFRRVLSTWDATMVVVGGIIGAGIFINPYIVARSLDSTVAVIAAWVTGGLIALAGAFAYAELGAVAPRAGGQYVYLRDATGTQRHRVLVRRREMRYQALGST